jgi:hypothetical protein
MFDKYDEYIENLLVAQYDVSDIIEHYLTKGEVREDFLKTQVKEQFQDITLHKGLICHSENNYQSSQIDIIVTNRSARCRQLGTHSLIDLNDVKLVIEVKSCAKTSDFRDLNSLAKRIKSLIPNLQPRVGIFCYDYQIQKKNLLRKFGYKYDSEIESFYRVDSDIPEFNNIDFVLSLDVLKSDKDFFLVKDISGTFTLFDEKPTSKYFFNMFKLTNDVEN